MLEDIDYGGSYRDDSITVTVTLEDPERHGIDAGRLAFMVTASMYNGDAFPGECLVFYLMSDSNFISNTEFIPIEASKHIATEARRSLNGLIHMELHHGYLFQSLRVAFYYLPYNRIEIIQLKHRPYG